LFEATVNRLTELLEAIYRLPPRAVHPAPTRSESLSR
jgi:hypothetical protein